MENREQKLFVKGYNDGYTIEDDRPGFMNTIVKGITSSNGDPYLEGLLEGHKQRENERKRERIRQSIERGNREKGDEKERSR